MDRDKSNYSVLSDKAIQRYQKTGEIIISPFKRKNLNTSSYDVTLGEWYFRENIDYIVAEDESSSGDGCGHCVAPVYNIYSQDMVHKVWGEPIKAREYLYHKQYPPLNGCLLENVDETDQIIIIGPGETILAHTNEFIGGVNHVTTMMKARSSIGRNFIEVCKCAGWGDVGYYNRWTMEITNNSRHYQIPLIVGKRIAQIVFFDTEGIMTSSYNADGKYQHKSSLKELQENWSPMDMLPKLYFDTY